MSSEMAAIIELRRRELDLLTALLRVLLDPVTTTQQADRIRARLEAAMEQAA